MRNYKCLNKNTFTEGNYTLVPLRDEDKYEILEWRNSQIDILRQQAPLTKESQENYFKTVIAPLFEQEKPNQILWSFLLDNKLIGYGGLVHIDWENKTGEISFLTETSRNKSSEVFISDWYNYLSILKPIAQNELGFNSIFTYAYDIRPNLYVALEKAGFKETNRVKNSIEIAGKMKDTVIHTCFFDELKMRFANENDADLYFKWANDKVVRENSYNTAEINYEQHINWFKSKLLSKECFFYLFLNKENTAIGQVRIDKSNDEIIIGISIDEKFRGKGLGVKLLNKACNDYLSKFKTAEIIAYIKEENIASINQFSKASFIKTENVIIGNNKSYRFKRTINEGH
ncbi:MAG: GNAT family N-acetyltransferase [Bacteroidetes bacterium]|nr:GNAT family N-acetyltransferase [Bacteroidota bacterium]